MTFINHYFWSAYELNIYNILIDRKTLLPSNCFDLRCCSDVRVVELFSKCKRFDFRSCGGVSVVALLRKWKRGWRSSLTWADRLFPWVQRTSSSINLKIEWVHPQGIGNWFSILNKITNINWTYYNRFCILVEHIYPDNFADFGIFDVLRNINLSHTSDLHDNLNSLLQI